MPARAFILVLLYVLTPSCMFLRARPLPVQPRTTDSGLVIYDITIPTAGPQAALGDLVTIDYEIRLEDGSVVDSSIERAEPVTFELGSGDVPPGLEEGLVGLPIFGRRKLRVPPALGYGSAGRPPRVPGNAVLVIEVELLELGSVASL